MEVEVLTSLSDGVMLPAMSVEGAPSHVDQCRIFALSADAVVGQVNVCARHGLPVFGRWAVKVESAPAVLSWVLLLLPSITVLPNKRRVEGWPMCRQCCALRNRRMLTAFIGVVVMPVTCVAGTALSNAGFQELVDPVLLVLLVGLFIGTVLTFSSTADRRIARASLTSDGAWVLVNRPSAAFVDSVGMAASQALRGVAG